MTATITNVANIFATTLTAIAMISMGDEIAQHKYNRNHDTEPMREVYRHMCYDTELVLFVVAHHVTETGGNRMRTYSLSGAQTNGATTSHVSITAEPVLTLEYRRSLIRMRFPRTSNITHRS